MQHGKLNRKKSKVNAAVTVLVMLAALWFFSTRSDDKAHTAPVTQPPRTPAQSAAAPTGPSASGEASSSLPQAQQLPAAMPPGRAIITQPSGPTELPPDIAAQLNAPPPELPADLKAQLNSPPPELPDDLKAQLNAPPPELPDDIKRALQTPPRIVTIDEVNNPNYLKEKAPAEKKETK